MTPLASTRCRPRHSPSWSAAERRDKHAHYAPAYALLRCQKAVPIKSLHVTLVQLVRLHQENFLVQTARSLGCCRPARASRRVAAAAFSQCLLPTLPAGRLWRVLLHTRWQVRVTAVRLPSQRARARRLGQAGSGAEVLLTARGGNARVAAPETVITLFATGHTKGHEPICCEREKTRRAKSRRRVCLVEDTLRYG